MVAAEAVITAEAVEGAAMPRVAAVATAAAVDITNDVKQAPSGAGAVSNGRPFYVPKSKPLRGESD
jgi:hypothetical protein